MEVRPKCHQTLGTSFKNTHKSQARDNEMKVENNDTYSVETAASNIAAPEAVSQPKPEVRGMELRSFEPSKVFEDGIVAIA